MNGNDVIRDTDELRPRIAPFLDAGEQLDVVLRASSRPAKAVKLVALQAWPYFHEKDRFLLAATDRQWLVLETAKEQFAGEITVRAALPRTIRVRTSWVTRIDGFDQPYAIDPIYELWAVAANAALDARSAGREWDLHTAAAALTADDNDALTEKLGSVVMTVGRYVPRRRRP